MKMSKKAFRAGKGQGGAAFSFFYKFFYRIYKKTASQKVLKLFPPDESLMKIPNLKSLR